MKNEEHNKDKWLKEHINDDRQSSVPSSNFTHKVMQEIHKEAEKPAIQPLPLFGWTGWLVTSIFGVLMVLSIVFSSSFQSKVNRPFNLNLPDLNNLLQSDSFTTFSLVITSVSLLIAVDHFLLKKLR